MLEDYVPYAGLLALCSCKQKGAPLGWQSCVVIYHAKLDIKQDYKLAFISYFKLHVKKHFVVLHNA